MHNLIKVFAVIFILSSPLHASSIYEKSAMGVVLLIGDKGFGSGVIISPKGYILTNNHVVDGNENLEAILSYKYDLGEYEEYVHSVKIIKKDITKDLALLKIIKPTTALKAIDISRNIPSIGSQVHAIGHPDLEVWSYTTGYISQIRDDYEWSYEDDIEHIANVYQTQTPIAEGNSGGPLLNNHGNLVGLNTFGDGENDFQNFSITVDEIVKFLIN